MANNKDIEEALLSGASLDDLIKKKFNQEIESEIKNSKISHKLSKVTDFDKLPSSETFAKSTTYLVFNRNTKQESYVNGIQAESLIGLQPQVREKLANKLVDCFLTDNYYVKFYCAESLGGDES